MATRRETQQQLAKMEDVLRRQLRRGTNATAKLPPVRQLAEEHGVSVYIAHQAVQKLKKEGLLQTRGKLGAFASTPKASQREIYAITSRTEHPLDKALLVQRGFEARIAERGGAVTVLGPNLDEWNDPESWSHIAGVLEFPTFLPFSVDCPRARILERDVAQQFQTPEHPFDVVHLDNEDGAAQAVAHLMFEGHLNIAFLGVHHPAMPLALSWSQQREEGWRKALEEAGISTKKLAFRPQKSWEDLGRYDFPDETILAQDAVQQLCDALESRNITSVIAANDIVGLVLIEELKRREVPVGLWPSIVGFDGGEIASEWLLSSLRLPWEDAGAAAADLLWERRHGMAPDEPQARWVRMRLIPRLTCRSGWVNTSQAPQSSTR